MCLKGVNTIKQPPRIPTIVQSQVTGTSFWRCCNVNS